MSYLGQTCGIFVRNYENQEGSLKFKPNLGLGKKYRKRVQVYTPITQYYASATSCFIFVGNM